MWLTIADIGSSQSILMLHSRLCMFAIGNKLRVHITETEYDLLFQAFVVAESCEVKVTPVGKHLPLNEK
jgi:hypothetical protein